MALITATYFECGVRYERQTKYLYVFLHDTNADAKD